MEKLKDIFNNIKDRFSNPLIFSFICSWLVVNWPITIALVWYDSAEIQKTGCSSIFEFISDKLKEEGSFLKPIIFALAYTLLMPTIKNLIRALYSWTAKWGDNWNLEISKGVKIPFEKYLRFREDYDKRSKILEDVISKENELVNNYNSLNTELLQAKATINELRQKQNENSNFYSQLNNIKILDGYWTNKYSDTANRNLNGEENIYIKDGQYFIIDKFGGRKIAFRIINFYYNNITKAVSFVKENVEQSEKAKLFGEHANLKFNINLLQIKEEGWLIGIENGTTNIQYLKKSE